MKLTTFALIATILSSCNQNSAEKTEQQLRQANFELKRVNDSLPAVIEKSERTFEGDTIQKTPENAGVQAIPTLAGRHDLTLQWISWDKPGSVMIAASENGWHKIKGSQKGEQGSYLTIEGKVKALNDRELEFEGKIAHNVHPITTGGPCIRTGKQIFKATGTRKYWRLQNMLSCDSTTTDYGDIYF